MQTLYRKHELARELKIDSRAIARIGLMPTANGPDGRPLYELDNARKQLEAYFASRKEAK